MPACSFFVKFFSFDITRTVQISRRSVKYDSCLTVGVLFLSFFPKLTIAYNEVSIGPWWHLWADLVLCVRMLPQWAGQSKAAFLVGLAGWAWAWNEKLSLEAWYALFTLSVPNFREFNYGVWQKFPYVDDSVDEDKKRATRIPETKFTNRKNLGWAGPVWLSLEP